MTADPNPIIVQKVARYGRLTWMLILGVAGTVELIGVIDPAKDDTLSETTRWMWDTKTPAGSWAFRLFWVAFSAWMGPHIVKISRQKVGK